MGMNAIPQGGCKWQAKGMKCGQKGGRVSVQFWSQSEVEMDETENGDFLLLEERSCRFGTSMERAMVQEIQANAEEGTLICSFCNVPMHFDPDDDRVDGFIEGGTTDDYLAMIDADVEASVSRASRRSDPTSSSDDVSLDWDLEDLDILS